MSISQEKNKQIGRTGVSPVGDQFAQQMQQGQPIEADQELGNQLVPPTQQAQPQ